MPLALNNHHDFKFHASYKYADIVRSHIFTKHYDCLIERLDGFDAKALKPSKRTLLHEFIDYVVSEELEFELGDAFNNDHCGEGVIKLCADYSIPCQSMEDFIEQTQYSAYEYNSEYLWDLCADLIPKITTEVFTLLFSDREAMAEFNKSIAEEVRELCVENEAQLLRCDGVIKRNKYWPKWLEKALFCREKGLCALCKCDLSSLHHTIGKLAIDHIVPLNLGGTNDSTNLQVLCQECNNTKSGDIVKTSNELPLYW